MAAIARASAGSVEGEGALRQSVQGRFDRSMWGGCNGIQLNVASIVDATLKPGMTEQDDALAIARHRVQALHAKLNTGIGDVDQSDSTSSIVSCESALALIDEIDAATNATADVSSPEALVDQAAAKGQALVKILEELDLGNLVEGGPVNLPYPEGMSERTVMYAQMNWETNEETNGQVNWTDDATLTWVRYGLAHGHNTPGVMPAALCLLARVERRPEAVFEGNKASMEALGMLKEVARDRLDAIQAGHLDPSADDTDNASVVWRAVCEAESMLEMSAMFSLYRDPTSDISPDDDNEESDSDYAPEEEGPLFMEAYAACDVCQQNLYLPGDQTCPGMGEECGGLTPFVITPEQNTEENSFACDMCSKLCPVGEHMSGCRDCEFDLCSSCAGPWYHEINSGRDYCGKHYAVAEDKDLFILVTEPSDLGANENDYFGDEVDYDHVEGGAGGKGVQAP